MALKTVPLKNKPLCVFLHHGSIYMGDARGNIHIISGEYTKPRIMVRAPGPVSAIAYANGIFYGTWDGVIYSETSSRKLGVDMVKCMIIWGNEIFVSVDHKLFKLDLNLNIIEEYDTQSKIYSAECAGDRIIFGMGHGYTSIYSDHYEEAKRSAHEASIISLRNGLSGDTYGELRRNHQILYSNKGWIRSIWDADLFSSGKDIVKDGDVLYSHSDEVIGLLMLDGMIFSFGLDYCYKIFSKDILIDANEEDELMKLLNS